MYFVYCDDDFPNKIKFKKLYTNKNVCKFIEKRIEIYSPPNGLDAYTIIEGKQLVAFSTKTITKVELK